MMDVFVYGKEFDKLKFHMVTIHKMLSDCCDDTNPQYC